MAAGEDDQTVAPSLNVVKHVCVWRPAIVARKRIAIRAVKAVSRAAPDARTVRVGVGVARAERNESSAQRLERASCEPHNDRATADDRDVDLHAFNAALVHEFGDDVFPLRHRPRGVSDHSQAAGMASQTLQNGGRSRHGTAIDHFADAVVLCGRHRAPPVAHVRQLAALIELGGSSRTPQRTCMIAIRAKSG